MSQSRKNILFMLHLPPPVHGSTIVGELVRKSKVINESFQGRYINLIRINISFNRTTVECKLQHHMSSLNLLTSFNRTTVECK